jgi:hypothetical protein
MHVSRKMIPVETIPGMEGEEIKENDGGGEFICYICYIIKMFINITMSSQHNYKNVCINLKTLE